MYNMGHVQFREVDCIYYEEQDGIRLIPINENDNIVKYMGERNFTFTYKGAIYKYTAFIEKVKPVLQDRSIVLIPKYIFASNADDTTFHGFEIIGDAIDDFFNPINYFYPKVRKGEELGDILYHKKHADNWKIKFEGYRLNISLSYGDVLTNGSGSDLMVHPKLIINFDKDTEDLQFIYSAYSVIIRFLQIVRYDLDFGYCRIELINRSGYFGGRLYDFNEYGQKYSKQNFYKNYSYFKPYIGKLLQFSADNLDVVINYFPKSTVRIEQEAYSPELLVAIFGAFENEYGLSKDVYGVADTTRIQSIKDEVLFNIDKIRFTAKNDDERGFIETAIKGIQKIGNEFGQTQKICKVYNVLINALKSSIQNIFYLFDDNTIKNMEGGDIKDISKELASLRGRAAHGAMSECDEKQTQMIKFLEILVYAQMLRRAGLNDKKIELIIGLVFLCNFEHQKI